MTNKSWKKIWNKNAKQIKPKNLNDLLKLNGHSSATSEINRKPSRRWWPKADLPKGMLVGPMRTRWAPNGPNWFWLPCT